MQGAWVPSLVRELELLQLKKILHPTTETPHMAIPVQPNTFKRGVGGHSLSFSVPGGDHDSGLWLLENGSQREATVLSWSGPDPPSCLAMSPSDG